MYIFINFITSYSKEYQSREIFHFGAYAFLLNKDSVSSVREVSSPKIISLLSEHHEKCYPACVNVPTCYLDSIWELIGIKNSWHENKGSPWCMGVRTFYKGRIWKNKEWQQQDITISWHLIQWFLCKLPKASRLKRKTNHTAVECLV